MVGVGDSVSIGGNRPVIWGVVLLIVILPGCVAPAAFVPEIGIERPAIGTVYTFAIEGALLKTWPDMAHVETVVVDHLANGWRLAVASRTQAAAGPIAGGRLYYLGADLNASTYSGIPNKTLIAFPLEEGKEWTTRLAAAADTFYVKAHRVEALSPPWEDDSGWRIDGRSEVFVDSRLVIEYSPRLQAITRFDSYNVGTGRVHMNLSLTGVRMIEPGESAVIGSPSGVSGFVTSWFEQTREIQREASAELFVKDADAVFVLSSHYGFSCTQIISGCQPTGSTFSRVTDPDGVVRSEHELLLDGGGFAETFPARDGAWALEGRARGAVSVGMVGYQVKYTTYTWDGSKFDRAGPENPSVFVPESERDGEGRRAAMSMLDAFSDRMR